MRKIFFKKNEISRLLNVFRKNKKEIENLLKVKVEIDKNLNITIKGKTFQEYLASQILEAVALGFSLDTALLLLNTNYTMRRINLKSYIKQKRISVVKSRLIGKEGRVKKNIEELSDCFLILSDHIVVIIGKIDNVEIATRAVVSLIRGAPHGRVFSFLKKNKTKLKELEREDIEELIEK